MKVELSKREIEVILALMELGITFEITHGNPEFRKIKISEKKQIPIEQNKTEEIINVNKLKNRLRRMTD